MKRYSLMISALLLCACAGKSSSTADAKKSDKPVISVLDTPSPESQKNSKAAADVLDSPRFTPTPAPKAATPEVVGAPDSPKEVIKSYTAELQSIKDDPKSQGKKREKQISEKVRKFFDFDSLARLSLGSYWDQLNTKKKNEYTDLFTRLIEKSYLKRSQNLVGNYQLSYGNEKVTGNEATVACEIYKDDVDLEIIYELHKISNTWMIYNVVFDQVNLVKNYQSQFNQIIAKSKFEGLMDMMSKKLKEKSSDAADANL